MIENESFSMLDYKDNDWMSYVSSHLESHIFHHPKWLGFLAKCYEYHPFIAVVKDGLGKITAGLPVMELSGFNKNRRWVSLPFSDHCYPLCSTRKSLITLEKGLLNAAQSENISDLELRWKYQSHELFQSSDHVLTTTKLFSDNSQVSRNIKGNDFRKVRLGLKRGVQIEKVTSLDGMKAFYQMHLETRRRLGVPIQPWRFFQILAEDVIQSGLGFISLAKHEGEYIAGIILLNWNKTLVYKFSASSMKGRQLAASYPLTWDAINWGCENQYTTFDWGRSDLEDTGLREFKKRWASDEKALVYSKNKIAGSSKFLTKVKPLVKTIITKSPLWVCRLSGELLYRYFG